MGKAKLIVQSQGQRCNIERIVQVKVKAETDGRNVVESRAQTESQDKEWLAPSHPLCRRIADLEAAERAR